MTVKFIFNFRGVVYFKRFRYFLSNLQYFKAEALIGYVLSDTRFDRLLGNTILQSVYWETDKLLINKIYLLLYFRLWEILNDTVCYKYDFFLCFKQP